MSRPVFSKVHANCNDEGAQPPDATDRPPASLAGTLLASLVGHGSSATLGCSPLMPIDLQIQDELGRVIAQYEGPPLGPALLKLAPADGACFRFILPWADTTFNQHQITELKAELTDATSRTTDGARLRELKALIEFLGLADGAHTYVKFIGD